MIEWTAEEEKAIAWLVETGEGKFPDENNQYDDYEDGVFLTTNFRGGGLVALLAEYAAYLKGDKQ